MKKQKIIIVEFDHDLVNPDTLMLREMSRHAEM